MRSRTTIRVEAAYRLLLLKFLHQHLSILLITEYPKSGASWLAQLISEAASLDFPRQTFPAAKPSIFHGHYLFDKNLKGKTIVFWRDPRDIMISWYHHCLFKSDKNNHKLVESIRNTLNFSNVEDVKSNLPSFIKYTFEEPLSPRFNFNNFFDTWYGRDDVVYSSYEKLHKNPDEELLMLLESLELRKPNNAAISQIVQKYSFENQSSRAPGVENKAHFLRKGIVGDWQNNFTKESATLLDSYLEDRLILLGYEKDRSWLKGFS